MLHPISSMNTLLYVYLFLQALDREREKIHFDKNESKRIDYVLVYTATDEKEEKREKRLEFEKNLEMEGIELEHEHEDVRYFKSIGSFLQHNYNYT